LIEAEHRRWAPFKRALPKADQSLFDRLFDCAKVNVQAGVYLSRAWPFEVIVMAILLEQQKGVFYISPQKPSFQTQAARVASRSAGISVSSRMIQSSS
jgi:hypothetical protein